MAENINKQHAMSYWFERSRTMGNTGSKASADFPPLYPALLTRDYLSINSAHMNSNQMASFNNEDLRVGTSLGGQMSAVRRFFSLLTTFDFLFTVLLWLISTVLSGHTIKTAFYQEVVEYNIKNSLFDIVMLSCWRFIVLVAAYSLFRMSHWWPVAITTAGSGAFIIAKVFLYNQQYLSHVSAIVLLLASFVISWGEAWFLDFKVVPSELNARVLLARHINECTPRIPENIQYAASEGGSTCFFSTANSDRASDSENEEDKQVAVDMEEPLTDVPRKHLTTEEIIHKKRSDEGLEQSLAILTSDSWKTAKVVGEDVVQSQMMAKYGKVFKFVGVINAPMSRLVEEMFFKLDTIHQWNPTVKCSKVIQKIDNHTDVYYVIAAEGAGGLVSSRDFVNVRTWQKRDSMFICASVATQHPDVPLHSKYIRGEQGPSIYVVSPVQDDPNKCHVQWLLNTNLKGWLPQYLIDQSLAGNMLECIHHIRRHMAEILPERI